MTIPPLPGARFGYGADISRRNTIVDAQSPEPFEIARLRWVDGDYDEGGAYWGHVKGDYIYRAYDETTGNECFVRARSLTLAEVAIREVFPLATFAESVNLNSFVAAYIECALWSSSDTSDEGEFELAEDTLDSMRDDCASFLTEQAALIEEAGLSVEQAGHDFWLSRNGYGAGFSDRDAGEAGDKLTEAARAYSHVDLYIGEDNLIHA